MRTWLCGLLLVTSISLAYSEDDVSQPGKIMISAGGSLGGLIGGNQYKALHDGLYPTPASLTYIAFQADLRYFPTKYLGFEIASDFVGLTSASHGSSSRSQYDSGSSDLAAFVTSTIGIGPVVRLPIPLSDTISADLFAAGGVNYNYFRYTSEYTDVVKNGGYLLYDVSPQIGYYLKAGGSVYLGRPFFLVGELEYQKLADRVDTTSYQFDGDYIKVNFRFGMDF